tara:strand:+ start:287 stop:2386 length:2100 start_codon:yes stop_codon:yes gene_type:complete
MSGCGVKTELPVAIKKPYEMTIHDHTRVDDYYWMRLTDEQKSAKEYDIQTQRVIDYINLENVYKEQSLAHTNKLQDKLFNEMVARIKKDDNTTPYLKNGYYYYSRFEKNKEYAIHCRKKGSLDAKEEIILDENELAEGYDYFALYDKYVSPDNNWLAFNIDTLSRRFYTIYFKDLRTGKVLDTSIPNTEGDDIAWANDNKTIFYTTKNKTTLLSEKIYRHKLGTDSSNDVLVYHEKDIEFYSGVYRSKSGKFIIIWNNSTLVSDYHILSTDNPDGDFVNFTPRGTQHEYTIIHQGNKFFITTNWNAKNNRLMEVQDNDTEMSNWKEVIPHREDAQILEIDSFKDYIVINERIDGLSQLRVFNQNTETDYYIDFEENAYAAYISINKEYDTDILRYAFSSLITPRSIYDYNMDSRERTLMKVEEPVNGYNSADYQSERIYIDSRDGKIIPISLVYKKDLKTEKAQNLLLYGYGSYGATEDPYFSRTRISLLDRGFIFAIAHVRGGQIYGRQSYDDGKLFNKINTFNDFIDVGKYLIKNNYTDSNHLFCSGGSAGGLLIGAVINMAPELWKGAIAAVPFVDVVTTMLDPTIPLTSNEWDEWGDPREKEYYDYMFSYSPYDQVENLDYPNLLVTAGFFDSQVQYWEPLKWVAKLREYWQGNNKLLLHTDMESGHGGKSGRFRRYKDYALNYAFLLDLAGIKE